ncbi:hypothetical protein CYMTET_33079 [Cymbomonas tetramitiformis]|uniref:Uncharacterized protein n=1 Tax=Cymbomonas tetramitiformis TaxID=36881 RepID=A0AAE0FDS5_9CHLO|nr:hypothetical protein CYMTET_33079 [Cymbomonas tetramitiformis]
MTATLLGHSALLLLRLNQELRGSTSSLGDPGGATAATVSTSAAVPVAGVSGTSAESSSQLRRTDGDKPAALEHLESSPERAPSQLYDLHSKKTRDDLCEMSTLHLVLDHGVSGGGTGLGQCSITASLVEARAPPALDHGVSGGGTGLGQRSITASLVEARALALARSRRPWRRHGPWPALDHGVSGGGTGLGQRSITASLVEARALASARSRRPWWRHGPWPALDHGVPGGGTGLGQCSITASLVEARALASARSRRPWWRHGPWPALDHGVSGGGTGLGPCSITASCCATRRSSTKSAGCRDGETAEERGLEKNNEKISRLVPGTNKWRPVLKSRWLSMRGACSRAKAALLWWKDAPKSSPLLGAMAECLRGLKQPKIAEKSATSEVREAEEQDDESTEAACHSPRRKEGLAHLQQHWEQATGALWQHERSEDKSGGRCSCWRSPWERGKLTSARASDWVQLALGKLGCVPPEGGRFKGHSNPKGAGTCARAADASLERVCFSGGWSQLSSAIHLHTDLTAVPDEHMEKYFVWTTPRWRV